MPVVPSLHPPSPRFPAAPGFKSTSVLEAFYWTPQIGDVASTTNKAETSVADARAIGLRGIKVRRSI